MAPRHMLIALALLACGAEPGAQSSSPPAGQDTVLIAGHALYVQSGFNVNLFAEGLGGVRSLALGPGGPCSPRSRVPARSSGSWTRTATASPTRQPRPC